MKCWNVSNIQEQYILQICVLTHVRLVDAGLSGGNFEGLEADMSERDRVEEYENKSEL